MIKKIILQLENITPPKYRWIFNHQGFRRYFKNTGWMFFGQFISLLASFFVGAWLARYLGPSDFGIVNYAIAFVGLFAMVANLGIDFVLNRELVKHPERKDEYLGTSFPLKLLGGFFSVLIITILTFLIDFDPLTRLLIIIFSSSLIFQASNVITAFFQARVEAKYNVKAQITAMIISSALKIAFILLNLNLIFLISVYALDFLWQGIGFFFVYKLKGFKISTWKFKFSLAKRLWLDSWPLMLANAAAFIYLRIDQVMIGHFLDQGSVGIYAAAVKFAEIWYFLPTVICASLFPAIVKAKSINYNFYIKRLKNFYGLMTLVALAVAIPTVILAPWAVPFIFGSAYTSSVPILQIYIWSSIGLYLGWAVSQYLINENKAKKLFYIHVFALIFNITLNIILIPRVGLPGAALTTLASYLILPTIILLQQRRDLIRAK